MDGWLEMKDVLWMRPVTTKKPPRSLDQLTIIMHSQLPFDRACADFCVNGIVLKLRNAAFELDGKAVERCLPIMDGKRPFFTDVA